MIRFTFTVNSSFLNYLHRPITVPRRQVDYRILDDENLDKDDLRVICPNGERMSGSMVYSRAGFGPYYQLKIEGAQNDPLSRLTVGQVLIVEIEKVGGVTEVRLDRI
jgi:hypothetical protein